MDQDSMWAGAEIAIVKGVQVQGAVLNHFFEANTDFFKAHGWPVEFGGFHLLQQDVLVLDELFRARGIAGDVKIFVPEAEGLGPSPIAFVCYDWAFIIAARDVSNVLRKGIPNGFDKLCQELGVKPNPSTFVVRNRKQGFHYIYGATIGSCCDLHYHPENEPCNRSDNTHHVEQEKDHVLTVQKDRFSFCQKLRKFMGKS